MAGSIFRMSERKLLVLTMLLAVLVLFTPSILRNAMGNHALMGEEPYYDLRIAKEGTYWDSMIEGGRLRNLNPFHLLASKVNASPTIPPLLGLLSFLIFFLIIRKMGASTSETLVTSLILILGPAFISVFSFYSSASFLAFMMLVGLFLFSADAWPLRLLSLPFISICAQFGIVEAVGTAAMVFSLAHILGKKDRIFIAAEAVVGVSLVVVALAQGIHIQISEPMLSIAEFGGIHGYGIFTVLLGLFGIKMLWSKKNLPVMITLSLLGIASLFFHSLIAFVAFPLSFAAGFALMQLMGVKWDIDFLKVATVFVMICGLLFSSVAYLNRLVELPPDDAIIDSLEWLQANSPDDSVVLSHPSNGFWIQLVADRVTVADGISPRYSIINPIFQSRNLKNTKEMLDEHDISYIWIDPIMKEGEVWKTDGEGLLFLFTNNETFSRVYFENGIEIWEYQPSVEKV